MHHSINWLRFLHDQKTTREIDFNLGIQECILMTNKFNAHPAINILKSRETWIIIILKNRVSCVSAATIFNNKKNLFNKFMLKSLWENKQMWNWFENQLFSFFVSVIPIFIVLYLITNTVCPKRMVLN